MAGEWIKFEKATPDKPEVWAIAARLGIEADAVLGKLLRVWAWFDTHTVEGNARNVSIPLVDRIAGVIGFANAMKNEGWLLVAGNDLNLPNFSRHNGQTAKDRAQTAVRVARHQERKANGLTNADPNVRANADAVKEALAREEEEKSKKKTSASCSSDDERTIAAVPEVPPSDPEPTPEQIYQAYPRKQSKKAALRAIDRILRKKEKGPRELLFVVQRYCAAVSLWAPEDRRYIPLPASWMNAGQYEDDPGCWVRLDLPPSQRQGGRCRPQRTLVDPGEAEPGWDWRGEMDARYPGWNRELHWYQLPADVKKVVEKKGGAGA